jgi:ATP-dependent DNA helicase RecG
MRFAFRRQIHFVKNWDYESRFDSFMTVEELLEIISLGEDSQNQFKVSVESPDSLAVEICAFGNTNGGNLVIGVNDKGEIVGIPDEKIASLNQLISNVSSQNIKPPLFVETKLFRIDSKRIMLLKVPRGMNKPYEAAGGFWVKDGADKRRAYREELFRLFQASGNLFADESSTSVSAEEIDSTLLERFYESAYGEKFSESGVPFEKLLKNLKLANEEGNLTLAGLLLFSPNAQNFKPQFTIKATHYDSLDRSTNVFIDKEDIGGTLFEQYERAIFFVSRNLKRIQEEDFNSPGNMEIPEIVFSEAIANAIIHRDYFIQSQIMIDLFSDRLEILSPGKLPNTLTEENIRYGVHIERNPILLTFLQRMKNFKYTGRGSGIPRMIRVSKENNLRLEFKNDTESERFIVRAFRKKPKQNDT